MKEWSDKKIIVVTGRLRIYPATKEQMEVFVASQDNDVLRAAYTEMLENSLKYPDKWEWYALWIIELNNGTHVGELCFKGLDLNGVAEIGYGILEEYRNQGYATEAVNAIVSWAFQNPDVKAIEAETDDENIASIKVLKKCGFAANGKIGKEGSRFELYNTRKDKEVFNPE